MVKILKCYLRAKKSYGTLSKGAIFFGQPCITCHTFSGIFKFPIFESYSNISSHFLSLYNTSNVIFDVS